MSQGFGHNFDKAQRAYDNADPYPRPPQSWFDSLARLCKCTPHSARPCDGLMAGGVCDDIHWDEKFEDQDEQETEPDDL